MERLHADPAQARTEVEECINGRTVADGAYFGVDVSSIVGRLVGERQADGGWNCERCNGSVRSLFHSTTNALEGLLEFERATGGTSQSKEARKAGEECGLDYFRSAAMLTGSDPDPRLGEAIGHIRVRRLADGAWSLDWRPQGRVWFHIDEPSTPSR